MLVWNHSCKSYCSAYHEHLVKIQEEQHVSSSIHLLFFFSICCYFCLNYCFLVQYYFLITNVVIEFSLSSVSKIFSVSTLDSSWFQCSPFSIEPLVRIGQIILVMLGSATTVSSYTMAKSMGHEGTLSASVVMLTTLLSAFSLTAWLFILKTMSFI